MRQGLEMNRTCFFFAGNRLRDTQTPAELIMEDDDMIYIQANTGKTLLGNVRPHYNECFLWPRVDLSALTIAVM